jgi:hypothetical protein
MQTAGVRVSGAERVGDVEMGSMVSAKKIGY